MRTPAFTAASSTFAVPSDEHVEREPRILGAAGDPQRRLVEDDVHARGQPPDEIAVPDVALDDVDVAVRLGPGEVLAAAARQVVQHDHLAGAVLDQAVGDVRADQAEPAGDQCTIDHHASSVGHATAATDARGTGAKPSRSDA